MEDVDKIEVKNLTDDQDMLKKLSVCYSKSYKKVSSLYKKPEELEKYTPEFFYGKLQDMTKDKESLSYVIFLNGEPHGFARYSPAPNIYKEIDENSVAQERKKGNREGFDYTWDKKVYFNSDIVIDDKTVMLNQIYLDPDIQSKGLGSKLLKETMPKVRDAGYDSIIIEYNAKNSGAQGFYKYILGLKEVAKSQELAHIGLDDDGNRKEYYADVIIGYSDISSSIRKLNEKSRKEEGSNSKNSRHPYTGR